VTEKDLYRLAQAQLGAARGYYNNNVRIDTPSGPVNVRIPIAGAESMDLRIWPEHEILSAISSFVDQTPRLLEVSDDPPYQVHEFFDGPTLNQVAPRGKPVPGHVIEDIVRLFTQLAKIPREKLPETPKDWPRNGDTISFARGLSTLTEGVYSRFRDEYADHFAALGIPEQPLAPVLDAWSALRARPFVCVHTDVHRKNMIVNNGVCVFLDWELALWGDPVYDFAVHLHKMAYLPAEREAVVQQWQDALPATCTAGWDEDLRIYLAHEQVKSAIVDTVRYSQSFVDPTGSPEPAPVLVAKLTAKLNNAYAHWGGRDGIEATEVDSILRRWAAEHCLPWRPPFTAPG
jgi:aminoglycoside phosphotransferase (APT) family kinase protein